MVRIRIDPDQCTLPHKTYILWEVLERDFRRGLGRRNIIPVEGTVYAVLFLFDGHGELF